MDNFLAFLDNKYINTYLTLFITIYAGLAREKLPNCILKLFENQIFKLLILTLIAYRGNKDPQLSIMIAMAFTISVNAIAQKEMYESFNQLEHFIQLEHFENNNQNYNDEKSENNEQLENFEQLENLENFEDNYNNFEDNNFEDNYNNFENNNFEDN